MNLPHNRLNGRDWSREQTIDGLSFAAAKGHEDLQSVIDKKSFRAPSDSGRWKSGRQLRQMEADGTLSSRTFDVFGISEVDLMGDATNIELPDGSVNMRVLTCQKFELAQGNP